MNDLISVRKYSESDLKDMIRIWNDVVIDGVAFPQTEPLSADDGADFFASQTYCGVAEKDGEVIGLYILHPNNVGRCGHICNASYAVDKVARSCGVGEKLVRDCMNEANKHGFRILQFNAVVRSNKAARHLYEKIGFTQLGVIEGGFKTDDNQYVDICPYYISVVK